MTFLAFIGVAALMIGSGVGPTPPPTGQQHGATDDPSLSVALLLDVSASCWIQPSELRPALEKHFWKGLAPADRVRLGLIGDGPLRLSPSLGAERGSLRTALRLLDIPPTYTIRNKLVPTTSGVLATTEVREWRVTGARIGPSPVWDALYDAASALGQERGRRAIILLTDGRSTGNVHGADEAIDRALAAGVPVHVVSEAEDLVIPVDASDADSANPAAFVRVRPDAFLQAVADQTGGSYASVVETLLSSRPKGTVSSETIAKLVGTLLARALERAR